MTTTHPTSLLLLITCITLTAPAIAQSTDTDGDPLLPDPQQMSRIEASIDRALEYLAKNQLDDGAWPSANGRNNGINAICLLAFMGAGHVPDRGPYRHIVNRAVQFLASTQNEKGLYASPNPSHGPMYEHALATLAMIEAYGGLPSKSMRTSVQKAVDLIVNSQSPVGGWRYHPVPQDADLSVTVMQVVALRAAQNARLHVPEATMDRALKYVRACAVPSGGFAYQPGGGPAPARSAAGMLCLQLLGAYDDPAVEKCITYLSYTPFDQRIGHFYYLAYYAMQSHFQAGGDAWAKWHPVARDFFLEHQNEDGSWPGYSEQKFNGPANCYSTGFATMALTVYLHYLPAYQR